MTESGFMANGEATRAKLDSDTSYSRITILRSVYLPTHNIHTCASKKTDGEKQLEDFSTLEVSVNNFIVGVNI